MLARTLTLTLVPPTQPHGVLVRNVVIVNDTVMYTGVDQSTVVLRDGILRPNAVFAVRAVACIAAGCATSATIFVTTPCDRPLVPDFRVESTTISSVQFGWIEPMFPTCTGTVYTILFTQGLTAPTTTLSATEVPAGSGLIAGLTPAMQYWFLLAVRNAFGTSMGPTWVGAQTRDAAPTAVDPPVRSLW